MPLKEERAQWEEQATVESIPEGVIAETEMISGVSCMWIRAKTRENGKELILYVHGGGLTSGSILTHRNFAASIAETATRSLLLVDYRLLPENPFPAPLDDVVSVYRALITDKRFSPDKGATS